MPRAIASMTVEEGGDSMERMKEWGTLDPNMMRREQGGNRG